MIKYSMVSTFISHHTFIGFIAALKKDKYKNSM